MFFCIHCKAQVDPEYKACPYCGEAITDFLRKYLGNTIDGKYQIIGRLGIGGMGEVYKVLHVHLNAIRVIKLMRTNLSADPDANHRFLREARLANRITHPNVAALFDFSILDDTRYMVWEFIEGKNLAELIRSRVTLEPSQAIRLSIQALHGLEAIHRAGIVHRDVSPENLMITVDDEGEERVKIIDLGIAKQGEETADEKTKTGIFVGKWKYCSPEHLGMLPPGETIDGRADIYSFGIVLYEMLTGMPPFLADTPHGYLLKHAQEEAAPLLEKNPSLHAIPELEAIMFRALAKKREDRFRSAREFARELEALERSLSELKQETVREPVVPAHGLTSGVPPTLADVSISQTLSDLSISQTLKDAFQEEEEKETPGPGRRNFGTATLARPLPPEFLEAPPRRRSPALRVAMVVLVLLLAAGIGYVLISRPAPEATPDIGSTPEEITESVDVPVPAEAAQMAILGLNAFPWGEVTRIRQVGQDASVPLLDPPLVTPAAMQLPPGRYEVVMTNPSFPGEQRALIDLRAGEPAAVTVQFEMPESEAHPFMEGKP